MTNLSATKGKKVAKVNKSQKVTYLASNSERTCPKTITAFLAQEKKQDLLRFITCGSVDDGKSTLIGRLLWDSQSLLEDQISSLESDSKKFGTQGEDIDFALLLDGLAA